MKLGVICFSRSLGGLELNILKVSKWLIEANHEIHLFLWTESPMEQRAQSMGIPYSTYNRKSKYLPIKTAKFILNQLKERSINKVLISNSRDFDILLFMKIFSGKKLNGYFLQQMRLGPHDYKDWLHTIKYKCLSGWLSPLPYLIEEIKKKTKMPIDKVHQVPLCIEVNNFANNLTQKEAREKFDLPTDKKLLGFVGRIDPVKGTLDILNAFLKVADKYPDLHLLIVGEPTRNYQVSLDYNDELHNIINSSKYKDRIIIRDFTEQVNLIFKSLDIFVMASQGETFGMVTVEALCSGAFVIGSDSGGTPEILGNGEYGLSYKTNDVDDLSSKISQVLDSFEKYQDVKHKGCEHAKKTYSHHNMVKLIEGALD
jgi:D-inositol-3-phosphate glycosyltransferase